MYDCRCIQFDSEGTCVYTGVKDFLKVYGWEPCVCYDSVPIAWGEVADMGVAANQLVSSPSSCLVLLLSLLCLVLLKVKSITTCMIMYDLLRHGASHSCNKHYGCQDFCINKNMLILTKNVCHHHWEMMTNTIDLPCYFREHKIGKWCS